MTRMIAKQWIYEEKWWSTQIRHGVSHINNECNDGNDNDLELLGGGHSSYSQTDMTKWIQIKEDLRKLTYELSQTIILDKVTLRYQYTRSMMENTMHIHTCAYFSFSFFIFFIFHFFIFIFYFLYIHKCTYPEHKQMNPKDDINNG